MVRSGQVLNFLQNLTNRECTSKMCDLIMDMELKSLAAEILVGEARDKWDALDAREDKDKVPAYINRIKMLKCCFL